MTLDMLRNTCPQLSLIREKPSSSHCVMWQKLTEWHASQKKQTSTERVYTEPFQKRGIPRSPHSARSLMRWDYKSLLPRSNQKPRLQFRLRPFQYKRKRILLSQLLLELAIVLTSLGHALTCSCTQLAV